MATEQPTARGTAPPTPTPTVRKPGRLRAIAEEAGDLTVFAGQSVVALAGTPRYFAEVMRQSSILVRGSTLIIAVMMFLISVSLINFGFYLLRAIGATDYTGLVSGTVSPRGTVPLMFGYIFAAKVGCGMVAEIGAMRVNDEISAYEAEGIDPMRFVVGTRLAASLLFMPVVAAVSLLAGTAGAYFCAVTVLDGLSASAFLRYHWGVQALSDQLLAAVCMASTASAIVITSCFYGLRARGGPASVGVASARSLVVNLVLVHVLVAGYLGVFYGTDAKLPIGG